MKQFLSINDVEKNLENLIQDALEYKKILEGREFIKGKTLA